MTKLNQNEKFVVKCDNCNEEFNNHYKAVKAAKEKTKKDGLKAFIYFKDETGEELVGEYENGRKIVEREDKYFVNEESFSALNKAFDYIVEENKKNIDKKLIIKIEWQE